VEKHLETIELPATLWKHLVAHARTAIPQEAVGLLGGNAGRISVVRPLPNIGPRWTFLADPLAQYRAERALARAGTEMLGIYHSHPGGGVQLSPLDLVVAQHRSCIHVVVALNPEIGGGEVLRAYRVEDGDVSDVQIVVTPPPA
jgi:proteasome lid subunit RPN8/RPN11